MRVIFQLDGWPKTCSEPMEPARFLVLSSERDDRQVAFTKPTTARNAAPVRHWLATSFRAYRGLTTSMSRRANCQDNSSVESHLKSPKVGLVWCRSWQTSRGVEVSLVEYLNEFKKPRRKCSALGWMLPASFEQRPPHLSNSS